MKRAIIISSAIVGTAVLGRFVVYPLIMKTLIRSRLEKALDEPMDEKNLGGLDKVQSAFDKDRYKNGKPTISLVEARERSEQIWESYSAWFSSDATAIINAFQGLGHRDDVSKIAHEFYALFDQDLLSVLKKALTEKSQYNNLLGIISKLPNN